MHSSTFAAVLAFSVLSTGLVRGTDVTVQSGPSRTALLELFTSEGCSSCPPAETLLSTLRQNPKLWTQIVPVAFHVNYWDELGWPDLFATKAFTDRQRQYAATWKTDNIYTPEFVLNGSEWRSRDLDSISGSKETPGILSATLHATGEIKITFDPRESSTASWEAHATLLGLGVSSDIKAGENGGRTLIHDFVVRAFATATLEGNPPSAVLHLPTDKTTSGQTACAVWITKKGSIEPVQAAGGPL